MCDCGHAKEHHLQGDCDVCIYCDEYTVNGRPQNPRTKEVVRKR